MIWRRRTFGGPVCSLQRIRRQAAFPGPAERCTSVTPRPPEASSDRRYPCPAATRTPFEAVTPNGAASRSRMRSPPTEPRANLAGPRSGPAPSHNGLTSLLRVRPSAAGIARRAMTRRARSSARCSLQPRSVSAWPVIMRERRPSRSTYWCFSAAATCRTSRTAIPQAANSWITWKVSARSRSPTG